MPRFATCAALERQTSGHKAPPTAKTLELLSKSYPGWNVAFRRRQAYGGQAGRVGRARIPFRAATAVKGLTALPEQPVRPAVRSLGEGWRPGSTSQCGYFNGV